MFDVRAYAARIGYAGDLSPTLKTLRGLHLAHMRTVPFENLDIHLGRPIVLEEDLLYEKVVNQRRGGFCYELNGLFAALLREIGFTVTLLGAQFPREAGQPSPELDHLTLLVRGDDFTIPMLADVAAGGGSFVLPLRATTTAPQQQGEAGTRFRLLPEEGGNRLWRLLPDGTWERQYAFTWQPRHLADFAEGCLFHQTSPASHFTQKRLSTLLTTEGRVTLSEHRLITTSNGSRTEQDLPDEEAWRRALQEIFGIALDQAV